MMDLNDLRVFERVAALSGFSPAAKALGLPKSTASRAVARLEAELGVRLLQRTTRQVSLTAAGRLLFERCRTMLEGIDAAVTLTTGLARSPRGTLRISAGIGFGINVLASQLPEFLKRYPEVQVSIDLTSRNAELIAERVDVAIRMGELADSTKVATRLGALTQYLCASRAYLDAHGRPGQLEEFAQHQGIVMPSENGRPHPWRLTRGAITKALEPRARVVVNDALTLCKLVHGGVGIGSVSAYLCGDDILRGDSERVLPEWSLAPVPVSLIFPSRREISPLVRAFVEYMREANRGDAFWLRDPLKSAQVESARGAATNRARRRS